MQLTFEKACSTESYQRGCQDCSCCTPVSAYSGCGRNCVKLLLLDQSSAYDKSAYATSFRG